MFVVYELEKVFNKSHELNATIGVEMEVYLISKDENGFDDRYTINMDDSLIKEIYECFDERVFRDYYSYQLEIRTNPSDDPKEVAKELVELFNSAKKVARAYGCRLIPVSYLEGCMYNGFHVHISYTPRLRSIEMVRRIIATYPFIVDVARLSLSSPEINKTAGKILSKRLLSECHTQTIPAEMKMKDMVRLWTEGVEENCSARFYDVILNTNTREGRHRVKDVETIEVRIFDVIGSEKYIEYVLELTYNIMASINPEWINGTRGNVDMRMRQADIFKSIRRLMLLAESYVNPLTGTDANVLYEYFTGRHCPKETWIYNFWWDWDEFAKIETHQSISYLLL